MMLLLFLLRPFLRLAHFLDKLRKGLAPGHFLLIAMLLDFVRFISRTTGKTIATLVTFNRQDITLLEAELDNTILAVFLANMLQ